MKAPHWLRRSRTDTPRSTGWWAELQRSPSSRCAVLPLRVAFQRFPRLIREMSVDLKKPATLVLEGEDTEADKAIVEVLVEPLVHVLRNAMDHGVEIPAVRAASGKPAVATVRIRAFREGEHVMLEVADDGGGIDVQRVREVAAERKVAPQETLTSMSDGEIIDLIFAPGFSTATAVTELSGRGVGMDAVRTAVKRLGGHVEANSTAGQGTTVRFTLPFSVMMTRVMTVEAGGQQFGIPLDAVVETLRVPRDGIFAIGAAHAIVLRDKTIPLVRLSQALGARPVSDGDEAPSVVITQRGRGSGRSASGSDRRANGDHARAPRRSFGQLAWDCGVHSAWGRQRSTRPRRSGAHAMTVRVAADGTIGLSGLCGVEDAEAPTTAPISGSGIHRRMERLPAAAYRRSASIADCETAPAWRALQPVSQNPHRNRY